ncbi:hypothetical protein D3C71_770560 [compost metagenome]
MNQSVTHMEHTRIGRKAESKAPKRQMIALRMSASEVQQCHTHAASENRSASQFSYLMYLRGLEAWKSEHNVPKSSRRR